MMFKKPKCADCGYLCLKEDKMTFLGESHLGTQTPFSEYDEQTQYLEITPQQRKDPSELKKNFRKIFCYRHEASFEKELKSAVKANNPAKISDIIEKPRDCKYHTKYVSGYDPIQHLMRWENIEREQRNRKWSLVYMILGSIITIAGMVAIKMVFG